jgi:hypothetical protein
MVLYGEPAEVIVDKSLEIAEKVPVYDLQDGSRGASDAHWVL